MQASFQTADAEDSSPPFFLRQFLKALRFWKLPESWNLRVNSHLIQRYNDAKAQGPL
jgi:hypothetical protein